MSDVLFILGTRPVTVAEILLAIGGIALLLLLALAIGAWRAGRKRGLEADEQTIRADEVETRISELVRSQTELTGRIQSFAELLGGRQAELARTVTERLDSVSHRLGEGMTNATRATTESLGQLHERLAVVDAAQSRLAELSSHLVTLKDVLANKQSRGAFGQGRMEAIVTDGLPKDAFAFQYTLSNGKRPDCVVFLPGDERPLVIDAKFPLESITAFREAKGDADQRICAQRLRQDITEARQRYRRALFPAGRDAGHRLDVRAVGIALRRDPREFRRFDAEGVSRPRDVGVAFAPDARDPGAAGDRQGRAHARADRDHPQRSRQAHGRYRAAPRPRVQPAKAFRAGFRRYRAGADFRRQAHQARRAHRGAGIRRGPAARAKRPEIPAPLGLKLGAAE